MADPNHQTIVVDANGYAVNAFTTIPLKAGVIDHFDVGINSRTNPTPANTLDPIPDHRAGSFLPNVTIVARDIFGNHVADYDQNVTLFVSHGTGILNPTTVDMGDGFGGGAYQGAWRGNIQITRTGQDVRLFVREHTYAHRAQRILAIAEGLDVSDRRSQPSDLDSMACVVDLDVEAQSILTIGAPSLKDSLPDRDVRPLGEDDDYDFGVFDAVAMGASASDPNAARFARGFVYVDEAAPAVAGVRSVLDGWSESRIGSVVRFDSGRAGYRVRPQNHPLRSES